MFHVEHWSWGRRIGKGGASKRAARQKGQRVGKGGALEQGEHIRKGESASEKGRALDFRVGAWVRAWGGGELLENYDAAGV